MALPNAQQLATSGQRKGLLDLGLAFQAGTATLAAGTVTITSVRLTATSMIVATYRDAGGNSAILEIPAATRDTAGGQFQIDSADNMDDSTLDWAIIG